MLRHIQKCTETEARRQLEDNTWPLPLNELDTFIAIIYARGACGAKNIAVNDLWDKNWGIQFCSQNMARNHLINV